MCGCVREDLWYTLQHLTNEGRDRRRRLCVTIDTPSFGLNEFVFSFLVLVVCCVFVVVVCLFVCLFFVVLLLLLLLLWFFFVVVCLFVCLFLRRERRTESHTETQPDR